MFPRHFLVIGCFADTVEWELDGGGHYEVKTVSVDQWATVTWLSVCSCSSWGIRQCEIAGRWMLRLSLESVFIEAHIAGVLDGNHWLGSLYHLIIYDVKNKSWHHTNYMSYLAVSDTLFYCMFFYLHAVNTSGVLYITHWSVLLVIPTLPDVICSLHLQCLLYQPGRIQHRNKINWLLCQYLPSFYLWFFSSLASLHLCIVCKILLIPAA